MQSLKELEKSEGWKAIVSYLEQVIQGIDQTILSTLGGNDMHYSKRDIDIVKRSIYMKIINLPSIMTAPTKSVDTMDGIDKLIYDEVSLYFDTEQPSPEEA